MSKGNLTGVQENNGHALMLYKKKVKKSYPCNRPWRPVGLWDVKNPTLSRQSAH
jgi:hypothetical protein